MNVIICIEIQNYPSISINIKDISVSLNIMKFYIQIIIFFTLISNATFAQNPNEDKHGNLEIKGEIRVEQSNLEVCTCLSKAHALSGVKAFTKSEKAAEISAFVMGEWSKTYSVNDDSKSAGNIFYRYEFIAKNGKIEYRFFHFSHEQKDSDFTTVGKLPAEWNNNVSKAFNKGQYWEIINAIQTDIASTIQLISTQCFQKK